MGQANFRRRRCPPRTGAERPVGRRGVESRRSPPWNDPLPVPTRGRDVAAALGSPGASERSLGPGVPRSPPRPWDEVSVRWGPSVAAPLPRGHLPGTEQQDSPVPGEDWGTRAAGPPQTPLPVTSIPRWGGRGTPSAGNKGVCRAGLSWSTLGIPRRGAGRCRGALAVPVPGTAEPPAALLQDLLPRPGEPPAAGDAAQRHALRCAHPTPGELLRRQQAAAGPRGPGLGDHPPLQLQAVRGASRHDGHGEGPRRHPQGGTGGSPAPRGPQRLGLAWGQHHCGGATLLPRQGSPQCRDLTHPPPPGS